MRILVGLALVSVAVPALADDAAPPKQEHKICRREQATGTRSTTKICLTAAEWRERDENGVDDGAMGSKMKAYNDLGKGALTSGGVQPH
jgi:hypothetical protein